MERVGQHEFPCGLRHPSPRGPESKVLCRLPAGPLPQLPQLGVGPALRPRSMGGSVALNQGLGTGVGACGGVMGTGGSGGPQGLLVVLCGEWAGRGRTRTCGDMDTDSASGFGWVSVRVAARGHLLGVGRHRELVGGWGRCWLPLAFLWSSRGLFVGLRCGFWVRWDEVRCASTVARFGMKVGAASVMPGGRRAGRC